MQRPRGSVNPIGVLMLIGLACAVYWGVVFGPLYLDNMGIKEAIDVGISFSRDYSDEDVAGQVLNRINRGFNAIGTHVEDTDDGPVEKPGLNLGREAVTVERNEAAKKIRISVDYTRDVRMKPTSSVRTLTFHQEKEGPIPQ